jgi:hypothetical protein
MRRCNDGMSTTRHITCAPGLAHKAKSIMISFAAQEAARPHFGLVANDGQRIEQKQVYDAERAPEAPESFEDQPRMADPGYRAETQHHLLIDVEHGYQQ